ERRQRSGGGDSLAESVRAVRTHERVRILPFGQQQELDLDLAAGERQNRLERPPRRRAARLVAVEAEDDAIREAGQPANVLGGRRRAERRDGGLDAELREARDVEIALDDENLGGPARDPARLEEAVELAPLVEDRRLRGVQVFRLAGAEDASAEADHVAARIADREHDPVAEPVVDAAALVANQEPGLEQLRDALLVPAEPLQHGIPRVGRVAQAE